jgi:Tfp pilus assembly protein PilO
MDERRHFMTVAVGGALGAALLGGALYFQYDSIAKKRQEIAEVEVRLEQSRSLVETTPKLEEAVIVHRETDEVVAAILPNNQDILNFVRTLQTFVESSGVRFTSIKDKPETTSRDAKKSDFQRVGYTVQFDGDAFELLSFLDLVESHERFMRVPSFKLKGAPRQSLEEMGSLPRHSVELEVETYVYAPRSSGAPVKVEDFEEKRDLLRARISARQRELVVTPYDYGGARNRRDPWVDPRVPAGAVKEGELTIEQQFDLVDKLSSETRAVASLMDSWQNSDNLIAEMKARGELENRLTSLEGEVRRLQAEDQLRFLPAERRFEQEVVAEVERIRLGLKTADGAALPLVMLREAVDAMYTHMQKREYMLALEAYKGIEGRIEQAKIDELRKPLVDLLREYAEQARTVLAFEALDLDIGCIVDLGPEQRTVLVEGRSYWPGEVIDADLMIKAIERTEVTFIYKGVVLKRSLGLSEKQ